MAQEKGIGSAIFKVTNGLILITLGLTMLPVERADEKLNLEIASGANYDILMLNPSQYRNLAGKNAFLPLDDLIAKEGPNVNTAIKEKEWGAAMFDGKKYGIPNFDAQYISGGIAVNVDMLKEAGVEFKNEMTLDEFTAMLKAIQTKFPDKVPFTGNGAWSLGIASAFSIGEHEFPDVNGELIPRMKNPRLKEYVEFMNKLCTEKLIDPEWPTNTGEVVNEKLSSGRSAIAWMGW